MPLIKSISGIRGTIGGQTGDNLTPLDICRFTKAYACLIKRRFPESRLNIVLGRDARVSGEMVAALVTATLNSLGVNVIDLGLATTPSVELAVVSEGARGGIIITASHNPAGWNALKLLNEQGEFLDQEAGAEILRLAGDEITTEYEKEDNLGRHYFNPYLNQKHVTAIVNLPLVDREAIAARGFKVVVDGINSVGGLVIPSLLEALGVKEVITLNCEPNGEFAHKPEPLAENLSQIMETVKRERADLGIVVDPDVDRLALIDETGKMIGEEYTLVAAADYIFERFAEIEAAYPGKYKKATVSNLSSSRALRDLAARYGASYEAAAVGEVNVVFKMKATQAVIGGEGNGGVIFPALHYGRDALVGVALILSLLARQSKTLGEYRKSLPNYEMVKDRVDSEKGTDITAILNRLKEKYAGALITDIDGVKIDWEDSWVHLRASNTEPIIRIYAEAPTVGQAEALVKEVKQVLQKP